MKSESRRVVIIFGENGNIGESSGSIKTAPDHLGKVSRVSMNAAGIVGTRHQPDAELWFVGCAPFDGEYEEAQQMEIASIELYPGLKGRTRSFNGHLDTSLQSQAIKEALSAPKYNNAHLSVILPLEHKRRATGQLKANGVRISRVYEAHRVWIKEWGISAKEKNRRIREIKEIYFSLDMYMNLVKEFGMNLIGKIDSKGKLIRKISKRFRVQGSSVPLFDQSSLQA